jgi:hypothetical protein
MAVGPSKCGAIRPPVQSSHLLGDLRDDRATVATAAGSGRSETMRGIAAGGAGQGTIKNDRSERGAIRSAKASKANGKRCR